MQLTSHFSLEELTFSVTAPALGGRLDDSQTLSYPHKIHAHNKKAANAAISSQFARRCWPNAIDFGLSHSNDSCYSDC
jgi:hypothetical protein